MSKNSKLSKSSTPKRHFTLTGILTLYFIAFKHSPTNSGSFIRQAPKLPHYTLGDGQPQFKFIS